MPWPCICLQPTGKRSKSLSQLVNARYHHFRRVENILSLGGDRGGTACDLTCRGGNRPSLPSRRWTGLGGQLEQASPWAGEKVNSVSFFDVTSHCTQVSSRAVEELTIPEESRRYRTWGSSVCFYHFCSSQIVTLCLRNTSSFRYALPS